MYDNPQTYIILPPRPLRPPKSWPIIPSSFQLAKMAPKSDTLGAVTLTSATLDDVPALIEIHTSAFKSDLFSSLMLSNRPEDAHQVLMRKSVDNWMEDSCAQIIKAVDTDERVLGWACWILKPAQIVALSADQNLKDTASTETTSQNPKKKTTQQESDPTRVLGGLMHAEAVKWQNKYLNGKRYMVLQALATHPSSQGHGIGTKLVQWGVDKADSEGLVCWAHAVCIKFVDISQIPQEAKRISISGIDCFGYYDIT
jgi:GNAT superfamily N-acetyltransferase